MCNPPKVDNTAALQAQQEAGEARQREEKRSADIASGRDRINHIYDGDVWDSGDQGTENPEWTAWNQRQQQRAAQGMNGWQIIGWSGSEHPDPIYGQAGADDPEPQRYIGGRTAGWRSGGNTIDDILSRRRQAEIDVLQPQLDRRYEDARNQMAYTLADQGITRSTEAGRQQGRLAEAFQVEAANIANQANQSVNDLRANFDKEKAASISQLEATADPDAAAAQATARSTTLASTPVTAGVIGDVFAGILNGGASVYQGRQNYTTGQAISNALTPSSARSGAAVSVR